MTVNYIIEIANSMKPVDFLKFCKDNDLSTKIIEWSPNKTQDFLILDILDRSLDITVSYSKSILDIVVSRRTGHYHYYLLGAE